MSEFTSLVVCQNLKNINFDHVPKSLRTKMINQLGCFKYLKKLEFGFNSGSWLFKTNQQSLEKVIRLLGKSQSSSFQPFQDPVIIPES